MTLDTFLRGALTRHFSKHLEATDVPQTYDEHKGVAVGNSLKLIVAGIKGVIHGYWPNAYPFDTSNTIIKVFKEGVVDTGRHIKEINKFMPGYLNSEHLNSKYIKKGKKTIT